MSLINDALKQARKVPPRQPPQNGLPTFRPPGESARAEGKWLLPGLIGLLLVAGLGLVGWFVVHRQGERSGVKPVVVSQRVAEVPPPVVAPPAPVIPDSTPTATTIPVTPPAPVAPAQPAAPPVPTAVPASPTVAKPKLVLQGIFYSPTAPSAIVNGKTVRLGGQLGEYRIKEIGPSTVTLVGPDLNEIKLNLGR